MFVSKRGETSTTTAPTKLISFIQDADEIFFKALTNRRYPLFVSNLPTKQKFRGKLNILAYPMLFALVSSSSLKQGLINEIKCLGVCVYYPYKKICVP